MSLHKHLADLRGLQKKQEKIILGKWIKYDDYIYFQSKCIYYLSVYKNK